MIKFRRTYRLAESENGGKDTEMLGEFLERESRRYSRRLDEEEERKADETGADEIR